MEYVTIYKPYYLPTPLEEGKGENENWKGAREVKDWDATLNDYAKRGYKIINSGTIPTENHVTFWAILQKA